MTEDRLHHLLERTTALLRAELRRIATENDLKLAQLDALKYLGVCNRYSDTPAALTDYLATTKGTVSQTILALEKRGLVKKSADPQDARVIHCRLTPKGRRLFERSFPLSLNGPKPDTTSNQLEAALETWLGGLQKSRSYRTFGICHSCRHHQKSKSGSVCGLTGETLTAADSKLICREHQPH